MATDPSPYSANSYPDTIGAEEIHVAVVGPDSGRRAAAVHALSTTPSAKVIEYAAYPDRIDESSRILDGRFDVIIIDVDSDPEQALDLVESIGANTQATVMVLSENADPELLVHCMRAGAREFLTLPLEQDVVAEALVRAAARRPLGQPIKKVKGKLFTFMGAKGGAGATTLACNFAVAMAKETGQSALLIDLDLPLGDAALNLGISSEFSAIDALQATERLDARFLTQLVVKHSSGLSVLAAPGRFMKFEANPEAVDWLLQVARQEFENVVVDLGSKLDQLSTNAYRDATKFYLVTQASIPELRNSNRLVSQFFTGGSPSLEIVVNRFESKTLGVAEEHITKALTRPAQWKIPNDYASVRDMQITATPIVMSDSAITRQIHEMVKSASGVELASAKTKKKGFKLFG